MVSSKILLLEDEKNLGLTLCDRLEKERFEVTWEKSVAGARAAIFQKNFDLALIDVGLPDGSGFDLARALRVHSPKTAFLFLTAFGDPDARVQGLELGAEDYVVKPFHLKELLLRIQNSLRRSKNLQAEADEVSIGKAKIYFQKYKANINDGFIDLSQKEIALLKLLYDRRGRVVSRDEILDEVWARDEFPTPRTIDNFVMRLRRMIELDSENPKIIRSVRGVGYQLDSIGEAT